MATDRCHPHPAEVVPVQTTAMAGVGGGDGMTGNDPGRALATAECPLPLRLRELEPYGQQNPGFMTSAQAVF